MNDELIEQIKELVRFTPQIEEIEPSADSASLGDCIISFGWRKVFSGNEEISLTKREFDLLTYFVHNLNRVLTYDQIYERIWKDVAYGNIRKPIAYHVGNLRDKLKSAPFKIRCYREVGYCFEVHTKP